MRDIDVTISRTSGGIPAISCPISMLGVQYDHNQERLIFHAPEEFENYNLELLFVDGDGNDFRENIYSAREYVIPNNLTQTTALSINAAFTRGHDERAGAKAHAFKLLSSRKNGEAPVPLPDVLMELETKAFVPGTTFNMQSRELEFYNLGGDMVDKVRIPGGGSGSDDMWRPTVSIEGDISWKRSGELTPPDTVNIMGPAGKDGIQGPPGQEGTAATIALGEIRTVSPDEQASAWNSGNQHAAVFNFSIPQGKDGAPGENGKDGDQGPKGADGYTPQKGVDYFTGPDIDEIVETVLSRVVDGNEVYY